MRISAIDLLGLNMNQLSVLRPEHWSWYSQQILNGDHNSIIEFVLDEIVCRAGLHKATSKPTFKEIVPDITK